MQSKMRPRKHNTGLPKCVYLKHGAYWLVKGGKWTRLGSKLPDNLKPRASTGMAKLIDDALEPIQAKVSKGTQKQYRSAANRLKYAFAEFQPSEITPRHVWEFRDAYASTPVATNSCLSLLRQIMDYAVQRCIVTVNPTIGVKKHEVKERDRLIAHDEYRAVYAKASAQLQCIMDLLYLTGQRVVDVLHLHRSNITEGGIYFQQKKTSKKVLVQWTPELDAVVRRAKALSDIPTLTLFSGPRRTRLDYDDVRRAWNAACEAAGIADSQMRDLRAMSLTEAQDEGKDATALAGHSSPAMTKRYLRSKRIARVSGPSFRQPAKVLDKIGGK